MIFISLFSSVPFLSIDFIFILKFLFFHSNSFFSFKSGQKKRRQTRQSQAQSQSQSKKAQSKPLRAEVDSVMQKPSTTFKYVPTRLGSGKISIDNEVFDYHFKSQRINFWKCSKLNCPAKAITRANEAWIFNDEHQH